MSAMVLLLSFWQSKRQFAEGLAVEHGRLLAQAYAYVVDIV
jgi:hypothetical protein